MWRCWSGLFSLALLTLSSTRVFAIGQDTCVSFKSGPSTFPVVSDGKAASILLSADDWPGVLRAASDFQTDIHEVTGVAPTLKNVTSSTKFGSGTPSAIIVGTLGQSSLINDIVNRTKLDVSSIDGQWEAFIAQEVSNPLPGIDSAYVIIGADKRGTIFALYDHSEQFGVSPWYWFADVPITKHSELFVSSSGCSHSSPTVKYRGIFLNDEQPALQNWAMAKFTNGTGAALTNSPFNHFFYTKLFELLLRFKANYLWPAQWSSAFGVDDSQNQPLADYYGIVMGTSHEEPMMRSIPVEWSLFGVGPWDYSVNSENIYNFWVAGTERAKPYENIFTISMRGDGDLPLSEGQDIPLLEQIVSDQRQILMDVYNITDVTTIPQMWALYQEVEGYYEDGMRVPDDVTLLWTDDLYGNVRRYPLADERNRTGGAGVYYHYDLVGSTRDYKWITSTQIPKTFEQMQLAVARDAVRIWILNVGDLKPYEMQTEFFITYGWNASIWTPQNLHTFQSKWAQREFDLSDEDATEVANIVANLTRWNSRRKPEYWNSTTYSLTNYREAENVLAAWEALSNASTRIYNSLPSQAKAAFFQLVQHPVQASYTLQNMYISAGINNLRASQARLSANDYISQVEDLFDQDYDIEEEYHSILDGKWDHMMDQTHVGYYYWQQPMANTMPPLTKVSPKKQVLAGAMRITPENTAGTWPGDNPNQCAQGYSCPNPSVTFDPFVTFGNFYFDVGAGGPSPFAWTATSNVSWLTLDPPKGSISTNNKEQRVFASVDWDQVTGAEIALISFDAEVQDQPPMSLTVTFTANHTEVPSDFTGFVEGGGAVSIEAAHASRNTSVDGISWLELPGYGRTLSAVTPWPRGGEDRNFSVGTGPSLEYDFYTFNSIDQGGNITVTTYVSPSMNAFGDDRPLAVAFQVDNDPAQISYFMPPSAPGEEPPEWSGLDGFSSNNIVPIPLTFAALPGPHTLTVWMVEPAVVVQKIIIDTGGLLPSYLGPPESIHVSAA